MSSTPPSHEVAVLRDDCMLCWFTSWHDLLDWFVLSLRADCRPIVIYPLPFMCGNFSFGRKNSFCSSSAVKDKMIGVRIGIPFGCFFRPTCYGPLRKRVENLFFRT